MDVVRLKSEIRKRVAEAIAQMPPEVRREADAAICARLWEVVSPFFEEKEASRRLLLAYMPLPDEVDIRSFLTEMLQRGVHLALPRIQRDGMMSLHLVQDLERDLFVGPYGLLQPDDELEKVPPEAVTIAIVPGRAFSSRGARLGRGWGYFDRLLRGRGIPTIAVAYDCQIHEDVPMNPEDVPMDRILTPTTMIECRPPKPASDSLHPS